MARVGVYSRFRESGCPTSIYCRQLEEKLLPRARDLSRDPGPHQFFLAPGHRSDSALKSATPPPPWASTYLSARVPFIDLYFLCNVRTLVPRFCSELFLSYFIFVCFLVRFFVPLFPLHFHPSTVFYDPIYLRFTFVNMFYLYFDSSSLQKSFSPREIQGRCRASNLRYDAQILISLTF